MLLVPTSLVALQKGAEPFAKIPFAYKRATGGVSRCNSVARFMNNGGRQLSFYSADAPLERKEA
jgi:hypothetical protein